MSKKLSHIEGPQMDRIRQDFPILKQKVYGHELVYLDNAATTQKPRELMAAMDDYYSRYNSNIHRGVHYLSRQATEKYEEARKKIQHFIHAEHAHEINFVRGTTEAINLVAQSYGRKFFQRGDEILITALEHHSNIVPWQMLAEQTGAVLKVAPVNSRGEVDLQAFRDLIGEKTVLVSVAHVSNALGSINPVKEMIRMAHDAGALAMIDGAQALMHLPVDVQDIDADFYAFSGHKMCGPTGIGVLYAKEKWLEAMDPYMGGGEMIRSVSFEKTEYADLPYKFEAGTPNIAGGIALGTAVDYLNKTGMDFIVQHDREMLEYVEEKLAAVPGLRIIGRSKEKSAVFSFLIGDHHPFDVGVLLDQQGVAIRTGHHCCQPLMDLFCIEGTCRASFAFYNNREDADRLISALQRAAAILG